MRLNVRVNRLHWAVMLLALTLAAVAAQSPFL